MFLLSYAEAMSVEYGFSLNKNAGDKAKSLLTSDYARATGVYMSSQRINFGRGYWWLRSPVAGDRTYYAQDCHIDGFAGNDWMLTSFSWIGVAPACWITLQSAKK